MELPEPSEVGVWSSTSRSSSIAVAVVVAVLVVLVLVLVLLVVVMLLPLLLQLPLLLAVVVFVGFVVLPTPVEKVVAAGDVAGVGDRLHEFGGRCKILRDSMIALLRCTWYHVVAHVTC